MISIRFFKLAVSRAPMWQTYLFSFDVGGIASEWVRTMNISVIRFLLDMFAVYYLILAHLLAHMIII